MIKVECECCGGQLKRKGNAYECEFCGSKFVFNADDKIESGAITDTKLLNLYIKAADFMLKGRYIDELDVLTEALELDETNTTTMIKMGRCYRNLGFKVKAAKMYLEALKIDPNEGTAYTNLGAIYLLNKDYNNAAKYYEQGLPLIDKSNDDYWTAYANYAICVAKTGHPLKAGKMIREAEKHGYKTGKACRKLAGLPCFDAFDIIDFLDDIFDFI